MVRSIMTAKRTKYYESESEDGEPITKRGRQDSDFSEDDDEVPPQVGGKVIYKNDSDGSFTDAGEIDDEGDSDYGGKKKKSPKKRTKTPAKKSKKSPKKGSPKKSPAKKTPKKSPAKKKSAAPARTLASVRKQPRKSYTYDDESEPESEEPSESESEEEVPVRRGKGGKGGKKSAPPPKKKKGPSHPPVAEMVTTAIRRLRDNPRKGSSLAAIKGFMAEEWGLNIPSIAPKIKKFILDAVADGELKQTKGKGASGRFTIPGMKAPKKRSKAKLSKKWDEDEPEYEVKKTKRDEEREKAEVELEEQRQARKAEEVRKELEKASRPKKATAPRKTEWEVEMITKMKVVEDETYYKVKWVGSKKETWEPEENMLGCQDAIDNFLIEEKTRLREEEQRRKHREETGEYEVLRILEVKFNKINNKRSFLVRWVDCSPEDDSWEPEENLNCQEMIDRFMKKFEERIQVSEKSLREYRQPTQRLNYASTNSRKASLSRSGFRVTYEDMDED